MKRWIIALLLPLGLLGQNAQALLEMKAPTSLVTDFSNVLSANDKAFLGRCGESRQGLRRIFSASGR